MPHLMIAEQQNEAEAIKTLWISLATNHSAGMHHLHASPGAKQSQSLRCHPHGTNPTKLTIRPNKWWSFLILFALTLPSRFLFYTPHAKIPCPTQQTLHRPHETLSSCAPRIESSIGSGKVTSRGSSPGLSFYIFEEGMRIPRGPWSVRSFGHSLIIIIIFFSSVITMH